MSRWKRASIATGHRFLPPSSAGVAKDPDIVGDIQKHVRMPIVVPNDYPCRAWHNVRVLVGVVTAAGARSEVLTVNFPG